jgi:hypothetical protein
MLPGKVIQHGTRKLMHPIHRSGRLGDMINLNATMNLKKIGIDLLRKENLQHIGEALHLKMKLQTSRQL